MKIVHELNQLDFGGVERVVRSIIKHDKVNEYAIIAYKDGPFRAKLEEVGAKVVVVGPDTEVDMDADVIHVHCGGGVSELAKSLGKNFPVIETIHSPVRSPMPDDLIFQRVGVCEAVSKMNKDCVTILNGIEVPDEEPLDSIFADEFDSKGKLVIGRIGRLGYDKGLEEWLLVCYHLQQKGYDFVPLIIGGEARNAEGYLGKLKLMAASLPVKNCIFLGHKDDVRTWFQAIDIFLYPSRTEGFGLVFAEALEASCAVVASETPVTKELFGGYALLVPHSQGVMGLVAATEKVLVNGQLRDELRGNGASFVRSEYDAERMSQEYQELYGKCCDAYPKASGKDSKTQILLGR